MCVLQRRSTRTCTRVCFPHQVLNCCTVRTVDSCAFVNKNSFMQRSCDLDVLRMKRENLWELAGGLSRISGRALVVLWSSIACLELLGGCVWDVFDVLEGIRGPRGKFFWFSKGDRDALRIQRGAKAKVTTRRCFRAWVGSFRLSGGLRVCNTSVAKRCFH